MISPVVKVCILCEWSAFIDGQSASLAQVQETINTMADLITVLIVEDEPLIRMDSGDQLGDRGFQIREAANAAEAIVVLERHQQVRVLFTDIDMPGTMDGLGLVATVTERWPSIKIIVTSGHRSVEPHELPTGSRFLSKPYTSDAVADAMSALMS